MIENPNSSGQGFDPDHTGHIYHQIGGNMKLKDRLIHAATDYDRKRIGKRGHNPYALAQYFAAIDAAIAEWETGKVSLAQALKNNFNDRLLTAMGKAAGLAETL